MSCKSLSSLLVHLTCKIYIVYLHYHQPLLHMNDPENVNLVCGILHTKHMYHVYIGRSSHYNPLEYQNYTTSPLVQCACLQ